MTPTLKTLGAAALLLGATLAALAAPALPDPTRPPAPPAPPAPVRTTTAAPQTPPAIAPNLQSLRLARSGESTALVDGRLVRVGDRLGQAEVLAIDARGLLLRGPRGSTERIDLLSGLNSPAPTSSRPASPTLAIAGDR